MEKKIKIAIDAMGGENSPKKIMDGIKISLKKNSDNFFLLYGKKNILENQINKNEDLKKWSVQLVEYAES